MGMEFGFGDLYEDRKRFKKYGVHCIFSSWMILFSCGETRQQAVRGTSAACAHRQAPFVIGWYSQDFSSNWWESHGIGDKGWGRQKKWAFPMRKSPKAIYDRKAKYTLSTIGENRMGLRNCFWENLKIFLSNKKWKYGHLRCTKKQLCVHSCSGRMQLALPVSVRAWRKDKRIFFHIPPAHILQGLFLL